MAYDDESKDPRIRATASVWGIACGMMGISIPLIAISGGEGATLYLPAMAIAGAAVSSLAIWVVSKISCYFLVVKECKKFEMKVEHILFL